MTGAEATDERVLRGRAIVEAADLFAHHGDAAVELLTARVHDPALSPAERRRHRLARVEVERLGRERLKARAPHAMVVWRPPLLSWAGIATLFGLRRPAEPGRRRRK